MDAIERGCTAVIFVSRRTGEDAEGYARAAAEMAEAAAQAPGYLGHDSVGSPEGEGITISYWRDEASAAAWRAQTRSRRRTSEVDSRRPDFERKSAGSSGPDPAAASAARARSR